MYLTIGFALPYLDDASLAQTFSNNSLVGVLIVATVIFCETGLVVLPFLPGDSLLFVTGTLLGAQEINPAWAIAAFVVAATTGDALNYSIGRSAIGQQLIRRGWVKPKHLEKTKAYFDRFGPMTITLGRFIPIVRTVAPFLAGLTGMCYRKFAFYNVAGAGIWCGGLVVAGYWLGKISWVREHLSLVTLAIVVISVMPVLFEIVRSRFAKT